MNVIQFREWLMGFSNEMQKNVSEEVSDLWHSHNEEAIREQAGRSSGVEEAEVLQSKMCQYAQDTNETRLQLESKEASQDQVRGVRREQAVTGTPCGPEHQEQLPSEHSDSMPLVPSSSTRYGEEAWMDGSWENGVDRVAVGIPNRVDRLRGLGNAWVPIVAATAFRILMERVGLRQGDE
jgi:hypothetical protein